MDLCALELLLGYLHFLQYLPRQIELFDDFLIVRLEFGSWLVLLDKIVEEVPPLIEDDVLLLLVVVRVRERVQVGHFEDGVDVVLV